ncbi:MAG: DASS family sodium-coupled anion symporter [Bifidobacteriaceae bacterium]|jgi:sodium-dependent dicarboxylate transporter 2/3/5|nr:DASS family sodium-coupled anion symporter [Bifidobacteriaceae bacterium]
MADLETKVFDPESQLLPEADKGHIRRRYWGLTLGAVLGVGTYFAMPASAAELAAQLVGEDAYYPPGPLKLAAGLTVLMAVWWMTEAVPLAATALLPVTLVPLYQSFAQHGECGVSPAPTWCSATNFSTVASQYASGTIFLFMGGFLLALSMQRWNLHKRIALFVVALVGTKPTRLVAGFMIASGFITMWVSNTATAVMMLPLGLSILTLVGKLAKEAGSTRSNFGTALMLGIAYASSIGSLSTLIGTPPNTFLKGYMEQQFDVTISFSKWMLAGLPLSVVFLAITWFILTKVVFKPEIKDIPGGRELIRKERAALGPWSAGEKLVAAVFVLAAFCWIAFPLIPALSELGVKDEHIAMAVGVVLFLLPAKPAQGIMVLDWNTAKHMPWDVLLLFGGGLALSGLITNTGLANWIGDRAKALGAIPVVLAVVVVTLIVIFLTELTSNTATAALFVPIMGGVALGLGLDPMMLAVPVALAATCAFMLPVATPPNAVAYGSGHVSIGSMVRGGVWLNVIGIVLITIAMYALFIPILAIG